MKAWYTLRAHLPLAALFERQISPNEDESLTARFFNCQ
jgi:hypothetical protein